MKEALETFLININSQNSDKQCLHALMQSILAFLLFLVFMNDLPQTFVFNTVLFANDTCVFLHEYTASCYRWWNETSWLLVGIQQTYLNCNETKFTILTRIQYYEQIKIDDVAGAIAEVTNNYTSISKWIICVKSLHVLRMLFNTFGADWCL